MMKTVAVLFLLLGVALSCKLPKYSSCNVQVASNCGCEAGLACKLTKKLQYEGKTYEIKQCMPVDEEVPTEELTDQDVQETIQPGSTIGKEANAAVFWYPGKECKTAGDCIWPNTCCIANQRCSIKLPKYFTCYFTNIHKCGCMDGLTCKTTTTIKLPIIDVAFPVRQCVATNETST